jgi:hypothetical protein
MTTSSNEAPGIVSFFSKIWYNNALFQVWLKLAHWLQRKRLNPLHGRYAFLRIFTEYGYKKNKISFSGSSLSDLCEIYFHLKAVNIKHVVDLLANTLYYLPCKGLNTTNAF